jgi:hypothetical protein
MLCAILMVTSFVKIVHAFDATDGYLDGIGYREQELQVAKGSFFESEAANGI